jgi:hypothetical protein
MLLDSEGGKHMTSLFYELGILPDGSRSSTVNLRREAAAENENYYQYLYSDYMYS